MGTGLWIAALERWRPEIIEPARHQLFVILSAYLQPTRVATQKALEFGGRASDLWKVETENQQLRHRLMRAEAELQATQEQLRRLGRVSGLRQWRGSEELEFLPADVIGFSTEEQSAVLTINRGSADHLRVGLPVVGQNGLAGVIREVADRSARVQALTDPMSAVGVADLETRRRGIVFGRGRDAETEFIPDNEIQPITPGAVLITSGFGNSLYPKGLIVGRIKERRTNKRGLIYGVIEPAENLSALEEVLVIRPSERFSAQSGESLGTLDLEMSTTPTLTPSSTRGTSPTLQRLDPAGQTPEAHP